MMKQISLQLVLILGISCAASANGNLKEEMECVKALSNLPSLPLKVRAGPAWFVQDLKDGKGMRVLVAMPDRRGSKHGMYVYTADTAYYYPLRDDDAQTPGLAKQAALSLMIGQSLAKSKSEENDYLVDVKIPSMSDYHWQVLGAFDRSGADWLYSRQLEVPNPSKIAIAAEQVFSAGATRRPDISPEPSESLDDRSRNLLYKAIQDRIQGMYTAYTNTKNGMSYGEGTRFKPDAYVAALSSCDKVPQLKQAVYAENTKFQSVSGNPGQGARSPANTLQAH